MESERTPCVWAVQAILLVLILLVALASHFAESRARPAASATGAPQYDD